MDKIEPKNDNSTPDDLVKKRLEIQAAKDARVLSRDMLMSAEEWDSATFPPKEYLLAGTTLLPAHSKIYVTAGAGVGKTMFALEVSLRMILAEKRRILYLAGEGDMSSIRERMRAFARSQKIKVKDLGRSFYLHKGELQLHSGRVEALDKLDALMRATKTTEVVNGEKTDRFVDLVVFDSLFCFFRGGDGNLAKDVHAVQIDVADVIKEKYGATVLLLHHNNKKNDFSGSEARMDWADSFITLNKAPMSNGIAYTVEHKKRRDDEPTRTFTHQLLITKVADDPYCGIDIKPMWHFGPPVPVAAQSIDDPVVVKVSKSDKVLSYIKQFDNGVTRAQIKEVFPSMSGSDLTKIIKKLSDSKYIAKTCLSVTEDDGSEVQIAGWKAGDECIS